ncbi:peptidyl-tRNA hydrolase [Candidatus Woesearchaeota archaeon]|nr:peptidyl-tRNA hydrolase [Candidatus Woesearchaeota archaeon]
MNAEEMKLVILVRNDLKLPKGKIGAQCGHAAVEAVLKQLDKSKDKVRKWRQEGQKKIVLKINSEGDLLKYMQQAKDQGINTALITDAGRTVVEPGTKTCLAIGPDLETEIDLVTGKLSPL